MIFPVTLALAILSATAAYSQLLMKGLNPGAPVLLLPGDAAILGSPELRTDLTCVVKPIDPHLGFDLRFHSGYDVTVRLQELVGAGNSLTAISRIIAEDRPDEPVYFSQNWSVPPVPEEARGKADLHGEFALGEGKYQVEWLLRDGEERFCSTHWQIVVNPRGKDRQVELRLARGTVYPEMTDLFDDEAPVKREDQQPLNVLVLFHVAPRAAGATSLDTTETAALLSILRRIAQEPRIGRYSIVAFNLDQNSIIYRREDAPQLDFPALGDAFKQLRLGTVKIQRLREKAGEAQFLGRLLAEETARGRYDAVIFVGSRTALDSSALNRSLRDLSEPYCPVFYLDYTPNTASHPWRDLIGSLVRLWKGSEYVISKPPDLFVAWTQIMSRLSNHKPPVMNASNPSAQ